MIQFNTPKLAKNTTSNTLDFSSTNIQPNKEIDLLFSDPNPIVVKPDSGYLGMSQVEINHPPVEEVTNVTITKNGEQRITPSEGFDATQAVDVTVNVPTFAYWLIGVKEIKNTMKTIKNIKTITGTGLKAAKALSDAYADIYAIDSKTSILIYSGTNDVALTEEGYIASIPESEQNAKFFKKEVGSNLYYDLQSPKLVTFGDPTSSSYLVYVVNGPQYDYLSKDIGEVPFGVSVIPTQETKTLDVTENGTYDVYPTSTSNNNRFLNRVRLTVNIPSQGASVDLSSGAKFSYSTFTEVPFELTGSPTEADRLFYECTNITSIPTFDTSKITSMNYTFGYCLNLEEIPLFDTSKVNTMTSCFANCTSLTSIPLFNTSNVTNMGNMFNACSSLTEVPLFDTSKVTNMTYMFSECKKLESIPQFDTSKVTNASLMFQSCTSLTTIPLLNFSNVTNAKNTFSSCVALTTLGGFSGLKTSLILSNSPLLTKESLLNVINNLATVSSKTTLTLGATNLAKLTDEEKAIATNKGWTLA